MKPNGTPHPRFTTSGKEPRNRWRRLAPFLWGLMTAWIILLVLSGAGLAQPSWWTLVVQGMLVLAVVTGEEIAWRISRPRSAPKDRQ